MSELKLKEFEFYANKIKLKGMITQFSFRLLYNYFSLMID